MDQTPQNNFSANPNRVQKVPKQYSSISSDRVEKKYTNTTLPSQRRALSDKIKDGASERLQKQYINKAVSTIPNPVARKATKMVLQNVKRVKTTTTNVSVFSWATPLWMFFQLPFAVALLMFLGITYAFSSVFQVESDDSSFTQTVKELANDTLEALGSVASELITYITGINIDPSAVAMVLEAGVLVIGFSTLIIMAIIYSLSGIKCVWGRRGGLKFFTLVLAVIGYTFPFFNLFPWFMVWAFVVNLYPE